LIFLDTNVVSELVKPQPDAKVIAWLTKHDLSLALSSVVLAEITYGIEKIRPDERARRLEGFPAELQRRYAGRLYSFDQESALLYGVMMGHSRRQGRVLSTADGMIAAIALRHGGELATRNLQDFVLPNLIVYNPWTE
jgi:predicted nucleic acid-binding protein